MGAKFHFDFSPEIMTFSQLILSACYFASPCGTSSLNTCFDSTNLLTLEIGNQFRSKIVPKNVILHHGKGICLWPYMIQMFEFLAKISHKDFDKKLLFARLILKFYTSHYFISSQVDKAKNGKKRAPPAISVLGPTSPGPCPCQRPGDICCFFLAWHIFYKHMVLRGVLTSKIAYSMIVSNIFEVGIDCGN